MSRSDCCRSTCVSPNNDRGRRAGRASTADRAGDDPTNPLSGLFDPNKNAVAGYIFNEFKFSARPRRRSRAESSMLEWLDGFIARRFSIRRTRPLGPATPARSPVHTQERQRRTHPRPALGSGRKRHRAVCRARAERAELFSRGPHEATGTFDIGNPDLKTEVAQVGRGRHAAGQGSVPVRSHRVLHAVRGLHLPQPDRRDLQRDRRKLRARPAEELNEAVYSQRDATFRGGEFQSQRDVVPIWRRFLRHRGPVRHRARHVHRRHQRAAHSAAAARRRRVFPRRPSGSRA